MTPSVHYIRKLICPVTKPLTWRASKIIEIVCSSLGLLFYFIGIVCFANGCIKSRKAINLELRSLSTRSGLVLAIFGLLAAIMYSTMHLISVCCYQKAKIVKLRKDAYRKLEEKASTTNTIVNSS